MTGSIPTSDPRDVETRPISVAELLAKNGTIGSPPVTGRRRRRKGNADAVTVAELTGEIPVVRDDTAAPEPKSEAEPEPEPQAVLDTPSAPADPTPHGGIAAGPAPGFTDEDRPVTGPRLVERIERPWPKSPPQPPRGRGPEHSHYPRPARRSDPPFAGSVGGVGNGRPAAVDAAGSEAEQMRPDPVDDYAGIEVDVMAADVRVAELSGGDSAYVRSFLDRTSNRAGTGGIKPEPASDLGSDLGSDLDAALDAGPGAALDTDLDSQDVPDLSGLDDISDRDTDRAGASAGAGHGLGGLLSGLLVVLQSVLAVAFGGGLFVAFDQLWRWNSSVALVLTGLVTLGLVAGVQAVRKTSDIVSTLIAVAVGLLVTLGPLALHLD